ncbi:homeobox-leucine zipper protein athb-16 [Quercus suber]|uniref:Homeobox-leucine zipper protein athb-16 n=1 Tax=Quercus suber TaxID=58331 RepID=A0AAW0KP15_QUESU
MKRLGSSDSLGALMSICPTTDEHSPRTNHVYSREFQSMLDGLDEEGCVEESGHIAEKKRRLSVEQIKELKAKLHEENTESINLSVKEEIVVAESDNKAMEQSKPAPDSPPLPASDSKDLNFKCFNHNNGVGGATLFRMDFKDGSSDSDSSAILNEDNSPNAAISSSGVLQNQLLMSPSQAASSSSLKFNSSSPMGCFQFQKTYQPQFVKMEEHNFFSGEEACNFFSDEQPPTLQWYCSEQWN